MPIRAVSHIAIGVRDMDRSLGFYRDLLGMRVAADQEEATAGGRRAAYLRWDQEETGFLVLDQRLGEPMGEAPELFQVGTHHVAFWIDDLDALHDRLVAAGVTVEVAPIVGDTRAYGEPPGGKVRTAFYRDPDGTILQFDQRLAD